MSSNTEKALDSLRNARASIFSETTSIEMGNGTHIDDQIDQIDELEAIQKLINKVEAKIKEYANN